ncbi:HAMP domain-containing protein [Edwardsiella tarda]|uniref:HAMP domain-containing protein n=1 Tax=Edwardsiella tarda TaxID=636 RepID=UPI00351C728F
MSYQDASAIINDIMSAQRQVSKTRNEIISLINNNKHPEALNIIFNQLDPESVIFADNISKIIKYSDNLVMSGKNDILSVFCKSLWIMAIASVVGLLLCVIISIAITRSITNPVSEALDGIQAMGRGDLTTKFNHYYHSDEVGKLLTGLKLSTKNVSQMLSEICSSADSVASASAQIAAGNQDLSTRTEEQASSLAETASALEQLTATVSNTADNTKNAANSSRRRSHHAT